MKKKEKKKPNNKYTVIEKVKYPCQLVYFLQ